MKKTLKAKRILSLALSATFMVGACGMVACGGEENDGKTIFPSISVIFPQKSQNIGNFHGKTTEFW